MKPDKRIRDHSPKWIFPIMAYLAVLLVLLVTSCGKKEEKVPERKLVRPVKAIHDLLRPEHQ